MGDANFYGMKVKTPPPHPTYSTEPNIGEKALAARMWLSDCVESHVGCQPESKSKLPTRVLDVSVANVGGSIRLCETKDEFGEYACLSHCWGPPGDSRVLRTVSETLSTFLEHIPWSSLPQTFRDTIDFVRAQGIRYLWIDSLCIIQDDPLDWDRESAKMADIYANCVISIAAWTSAHADGGLFSNHDSLSPKVEFAYLTTVDGERRPIYTRWHQQHHLDAWPVFSPLSTRAWVLQERLMAPRTVYFLGSEVGWECREETHCECGDGLRGRSTKKDFWTQISSLKKGIYRCWHSIVETYTELNLTFGKDMLPALSGLAKRSADINGDEYLAGLWRKNLFEDLLWLPELGGKRANPWRAPSWSWASLDVVRVRQYSITSPYMWQIQLVSASCELASTDPTGAVSSGRLTLRGKMVEGTLLKDVKAFWNGCALDSPIQDRLPATFRYFFADAEWCEPGDESIAPGTTVKILLLGLRSNTAKYMEAVCLVLRSSDLEEHAYERIGILFYQGLGFIEYTNSEIERAFDTDDENNQAEPMDPQRRAKIREDVIASHEAELACNWSVPTLEYTII